MDSLFTLYTLLGLGAVWMIIWREGQKQWSLTPRDVSGPSGRDHAKTERRTARCGIAPPSRTALTRAAMSAFAHRKELIPMHDLPADVDKDFQEEQIQEGQNVHSIPQFFAAEWKSLWPAWTLGLIAVIVIIWLRYH